MVHESSHIAQSFSTSKTVSQVSIVAYWPLVTWSYGPKTIPMDLIHHKYMHDSNCCISSNKLPTNFSSVLESF